LVHGAFADGSGWEDVANILRNDGYKVSVVQHPETSYAEDIKYTRAAIDAKSKEALASAVLSQHFSALLETLTEGGNETAGARLRRHFEFLVPSTQKPSASPLLLISTLAAEGPALPSTVAEQIAEGIRVWSNQVAALISLAQAEGQINPEVDADLLAALFINCWQGAMIRTKCDPAAPCDCLRFALDRVLVPRGHI
jgi:AcrR family transcriptional regulator